MPQTRENPGAPHGGAGARDAPKGWDIKRAVLRSPLPGLGVHEVMVLLVIADYSDLAMGSFPSVSTIASAARMSARGVQQVIRRLADQGYLKVETGGGRKNSNRYQIVLNPARGAGNVVQIAPENPAPDTGNAVQGFGETPRLTTGNPAPDCNKPRTGCTRRLKKIYEDTARATAVSRPGGKPGMTEKTGAGIGTGAGEVLELWAEKIRTGGYVPQNALRPDQVREIVARGMATEAQVHAAGLRQ